MDNQIFKAEKRLKFISQDTDSKAIYDARIKQLTDQENEILSAREKGIEIGIEIGIEKERKNTVAIMRDLGLSIEELEKRLGYDPRKYL